MHPATRGTDLKQPLPGCGHFKRVYSMPQPGNLNAWHCAAILKQICSKRCTSQEQQMLIDVLNESVSTSVPSYVRGFRLARPWQLSFMHS
jgi:hypothetical protein